MKAPPTSSTRTATEGEFSAATEPAALEAAVLQGAGIGFLSAFRAVGRAGVVQVLAPRAEWDSPLRIVTHVDLHRTRKVQAFLTHLKDAAKHGVEAAQVRRF